MRRTVSRTTAKFLFAGCLLALSLPAAATVQAAEKPNILFIFADDQCFETVHALGNEEIETPTLDRLVADGATFTHCYNQGAWGGAVCVASRMMLNTGRFLWLAHRDYNKTDAVYRQSGKMWAQLLEQAGYGTYFTGKWHVQADAAKTFQVARHIRAGMPNQTPQGYNRPIEGQPDKWSPYDTSFGGFWQGGKHWSEVVADDAVDFLADASGRDNPFFMYIAFNAAHDPRQSPKEYVDKYPLERVSVPVNFLPEYPFNGPMGSGRGLRDERLAPFPRTEYAVKVNRQEYYAIITHMDAQIARILDALEKSGKADNTWIFYSADHGLAVGQHGLMGKQNMFDHSVRVPLMVIGPGVAKNKKIDARVYLQDIMATSLELSGAERPDYVQFKSLLPLIEGKSDRSYEAIYGAYMDGQRMVTEGDFKLIVYPKVPKVLLFNVKDDPREMKNLAGTAEFEPVVKRLFHRLQELQKETGDGLELKPSV